MVDLGGFRIGNWALALLLDVLFSLLSDGLRLGHCLLCLVLSIYGHEPISDVSRGSVELVQTLVGEGRLILSDVLFQSCEKRVRFGCRSKKNLHEISFGELLLDLGPVLRSTEEDHETEEYLSHLWTFGEWFWRFTVARLVFLTIIGARYGLKLSSGDALDIL